MAGLAPARDRRAPGALGRGAGEPVPRLRGAPRGRGGACRPGAADGLDLQQRTHYLNARQTIARLLAWRVVPVVNENDTTATDEITFGDNDFLAAQVAIMLEARLLVLLTDTAGLHTADPRRDPGAELITEVDDSAELANYEIGAPSPFGLGGMRSKTRAAEMAGAAGIPAAICDGTAAGTSPGRGWRERRHPLRPAPAARIELKPGSATRSPATGRSWSTRARPGAARCAFAPVGITEVDGEFEAGDAVEVTSNGAVIGKGIVNYSATELERIKGMRSDQVRELFRTPPRRPCTATTSSSPRWRPGRL